MNFRLVQEGISPCCFKLRISNVIKEVTQRQVDHSKLSVSRLLIKVERKIDLVEEEHESEHEESESSGDESEDEEPRIRRCFESSFPRSAKKACF